MTTGQYEGMFVYRGRVQFYDCDPMGVVWHGNYLRFMEQARFALIERRTAMISRSSRSTSSSM